jgi:hypothetical protein
VQHNSTATQTHKEQLLQTAVGAHRVCKRARAVIADVVIAL